MFVALCLIGCVDRRIKFDDDVIYVKSRIKFDGDDMHVETFMINNDTLTIEPAGSPYPFAIDMTLADYRRVFSFCKENKSFDYQGITEYYTFREKDNQIILEQNHDHGGYNVVYANILDPRIVLQWGVHVGEKRDSVLKKLYMKEEIPDFHVLMVSRYPENNKTYFYFDKDTLCHIKILSDYNVIQNPEYIGPVEIGRTRGWTGEKLYAVKGIDRINNTTACYLNEQGDTVIPYGIYDYFGYDSIAPIGLVVDPQVGIVAINNKGERLFKVMWRDELMHEPDNVCDGLFRILDDEGKIGFADTLGHVVIKPQFQCALPFKSGHARVAYHGKMVEKEDYSDWESDEWFYIDKKGQRVEVKEGSRRCITGIEYIIMLLLHFLSFGILFPAAA